MAHSTSSTTERYTKVHKKQIINIISPLHDLSENEVKEASKKDRPACKNRLQGEPKQNLKIVTRLHIKTSNSKTNEIL